MDKIQPIQHIPMRALTSYPERMLLAELAEDGICLEIGCYDGASTLALADSATLVVCVDPFVQQDTVGITPNLDLWLVNTQMLTNVILVPIRSDQYSSIVFRKPVFDLVFIDGSHTYRDTFHDIWLSKHVLKSGGYMAIHDIDGSFPDINQAIEDSGLPAMTHKVDRMGVWQHL